MKNKRHFLISFLAGFATVLCGTAAFAQDTAPGADNAAVVQEQTNNNTVTDSSDVPFYDPSLIDPSVGEQTNRNTASARTVLEATHDAPMPGPKEANPQQGLPGEKFLNTQVEQISELNEIKPGPAMTLKEALLLADEQNLNLKVAKVKIDTAKAQLKQAWAMLLPNISASLSWAHMGYPTDATATARTSVSTVGETFSAMGKQMEADPSSAMMAGVVQQMGEGMVAASDAIPKVEVTDALAFNLTVGLSIVNVAGWFQLRMLDEVTDITELGVEEGRQQILAGVAQAYMAALLCGEVVKVQRVQLKTALDQLALAQGRYDRGADVKLSVIQAQFAVEKQRQTLIDAIWSYETARDALANLLNINALPVPQPTHLKGVNITTDEALEEEAIAQNRTLKINRMTQHVNELNLNAAIAGFFPTVSGFWKYDYTWSEMWANQQSDWAGSGSWTLGVSISIPLFDYSKFGVLDERKASMLSTNLEFDATQASTRTAVRKAKREYYSALFSVDNAKRQVLLAREALQLNEAAYMNGASTFIDVSNARNNVAAASIAYITSGIQSELSLISLISTLGRDIMDIVY